MTSPPRAQLADAWLQPLRRCGARGDLAGAGVGLLARWSQPHRHYHDVRHLTEVLDRVEVLVVQAPCPAPDAVRLAAWFHDAVYDPAAQDNETASADVATEVLTGLGLDPDLVDRVGGLVLLTRAHDPAGNDRDGAVLCDADLGVLAADAERYPAYVVGVRQEYAHLSDEAFARGRADVLRGLLGRPRLFRTEAGRRLWEGDARANVQRELAALEGGPAQSST